MTAYRRWTGDEIHRVLSSTNLPETARQLRRSYTSCKEARRRHKDSRTDLKESHHMTAAHSRDTDRDLSVRARPIEAERFGYPCRRCGIGLTPDDDVVPEYCNDCDDPEFRLAEYGKGPFRIQFSHLDNSGQYMAA